ncbi:disease resistance protein RGA5-like [Triticum dicoccoides]|uniref:disease resistance protein RGA5-like n=1 Tax=Triticum dicoccoides TaxID=85692 RepID=UPI000E7CDCBD|nr:disease resistance protein RGA5-like [Triticum dicoccoides]
MAVTMASVSTGVMNSLLGKLATLMGDEYRKIKGVRNKVASLLDEFSSMSALLVKLAGMDELDVQAREWRDQVREMSYDIEDCVDDFMRDLGQKGATTGFLKKTAERLKKLRVRHQMANMIRRIETRVSEVHDRRTRYKIDEYAPSSGIVAVDPRVIAIYAEAAGLVGIDAPRDELMKMLMVEGKELRVASIVGFPGLGKTTLANEVYRKLQGQFDCHAFVSVSQKPDMPNLLSNLLLKLAGQHSSQMGKLDDTITGIREYLSNKRYLIIIDDLWDSLAWKVIRCAFPENSRSSRVLTTTRIYSVAATCCSNSKEYVYKMKSLDDQDSRRLFFSRVFGFGEPCPVIYAELSTDILKRCGGLPLAIISISSLLAGQLKPMWEYVRNSLGSMFEGNPTLEEMKQILDLSYRNLPHHLKTCLLYLGMYPEDYEIMKNDLSRQWIAEGFVSSINGLDAEDVAGSYFNELINRSMIQPVEKDCNDEVLSCRVHDVMLDLIRSKSIEENFISVMDHQQIVTGMNKQIRRISLCNGGEERGVMPAITSESLSRARSVAVFRTVFWPSLLGFKYVRVLHLEYPKSGRLDLTGMCGLFLLRYVKIACDYNTSLQLPSQIGELRQLETFDLQWSPLVSIPPDIIGLPRLSHLVVPKCTLLPDGIGSLKSLRTLHGFDVSENSINNIECLGELNNMRDLDLYWSRTETLGEAENRMDALRSSLERLSHSSNLKNLVLQNLSSTLLVGWSTLSSPPRHLQKLDLFGCVFSRVPKWICQLSDLHWLVLRVEKVVSSKDDGDVDILARLPSLIHLELQIEKCPEERVIITGSGTAFQTLKHLKFSCPKLLLAFEAGAVPRLQRLELRFSIKGWQQGSSACLPAGIEHLPPGFREVSPMQFDHFRERLNRRDAAAAKSALRNAFACVGITMVRISGGDAVLKATTACSTNNTVPDELAILGATTEISDYSS